MRLAWYDRRGNQESVFGKSDDYRDGYLSPDETKIALTIYDQNSRQSDIWIYDIKRKINIRFTFSSRADFGAVWSPDGKWIVFSSARNSGKIDLYKKSANGIGNVIQLTNTGQLKQAFTWSSDNKYIGFFENSSSTKIDACILPMFESADTGKIIPIALFKSQFNEYGVFFSPDSKWIFFSSDESGQDQLYVSPFPNITSGKWQVSTSSVTNFAQWDANGRGIYYTNPNNKVIYVEVNPHGNEFDIGKTTMLFNIPFSGRAQLKGVTKDNKHFLFFIPVQNAETLPLTIVTNWDKKLKQLSKE